MSPKKRPIDLPKGLFKRGETYSVRYSVPLEYQSALGKREVIRGLGTSDLVEALGLREATIKDIQAELSASLSGSTNAIGTAKGITVSQAADKWLSASNGIKQSTIVRYRMHLSALVEFTDDAEVSTINRDVALRFIDHIQRTPSKRTGLPLAVRSVGSYQVCLAAFWRVLDHWGMVDPDMRNPFSSLLRRVAGQKKVADPRRKKLRPVSRTEAEALLQYIAGNDRLKYQSEMLATVRLLWSTGCRLNEVCDRHLSDLDDRGDHIRITIPEAKTDAGKRIVMVVGEDDCAMVRAAVERAQGHKSGRLFPRVHLGGYDHKAGHYMGKALESARKALSEECQFDRWDMHSFRRAAVSSLVNAGVAKELRNLVVGHANPDDIGMSVYAKNGDLGEAIKSTFAALHKEQGGCLAVTLPVN